MGERYLNRHTVSVGKSEKKVHRVLGMWMGGFEAIFQRENWLESSTVYDLGWYV